MSVAIYFFSQDTPAYNAVLQNQIWFQTDRQLRRYSRKNHILIIRTIIVTLTLIFKIATTTNSAQQSSSWCCTTVPSLVTKCSVVHKVSPRQTFMTFLNLHYDLDLECNFFFFFSQDTLAYDSVLSKQVCLQTGTSTLEDSVETYFDCTRPCCDLVLDNSESIFLHNTPPHDNTPPYQVWLKMVEWFRRYRPDKIGHLDSMTMIPIIWYSISKFSLSLSSTPPPP